MKRQHWLLGSVLLFCLFIYATELFADDKEAVKAFDTVRQVFQSPRRSAVVGSAFQLRYWLCQSRGQSLIWVYRRFWVGRSKDCESS